MADQFHTFTGNEAGVEINNHLGRYSQLTIGKVGAVNFGGGNLLIQKRTLDDGVHTIRKITSAEFNEMVNKTIRLELPDGTLVILEMENSTSPSLYVEHRNQQDR